MQYLFYIKYLFSVIVLNSVPFNIFELVFNGLCFRDTFSECKPQSIYDSVHVFNELRNSLNLLDALSQYYNHSFRDVLIYSVAVLHIVVLLNGKRFLHVLYFEFTFSEYLAVSDFISFGNLNALWYRVSVFHVLPKLHVYDVSEQFIHSVSVLDSVSQCDFKCIAYSVRYGISLE